MAEDFDPDKLIELLKRNGEWSDPEEDELHGYDMDPAASMADQYDEFDDDKSEDAEGRRKEQLDRPGDDHMFEQFLKAGDYAF